jgi:GT2 family glycosyltransferase
MITKCSVIIPTKNRPDDLAMTLDSIMKQSVPVPEIIIVDQNENTLSKEKVVKIFQDNTYTNYVYIHDPKISGIAQARNAGIKKSTGEIIVFFDDDVTLEPDYIKKVLEVYETFPKVAGIGGVVTNYQYLNVKRIKLFKKFFNLGIFREDRYDIFSNYQNYDTPIRVTKLTGCCCSYRRKVFDVDGEWFDEMPDKTFHGYSLGEDIDFSMRVAKKYPLLITPHARLRHNQKARAKNEKTNQMYLESSGWTYIFLKSFRKSPVAWVCYLWLCFGWFLRGLKNLILLDPSMLTNLFRGGRVGYRLFRVINCEDQTTSKQPN